MFLKAMPFELTYADDNSNYYNNALNQFASVYHTSIGSRMSAFMVLFHSTYEERVGYRNRNEAKYVRTIVPGSPAGVINATTTKQYPDGAGINEKSSLLTMKATGTKRTGQRCRVAVTAVGGSWRHFWCLWFEVLEATVNATSGASN